MGGGRYSDKNNRIAEASPCGGRSGTLTRFRPSVFGFPCQDYSTNNETANRSHNALLCLSAVDDKSTEVSITAQWLSVGMHFAIRKIFILFWLDSSFALHFAWVRYIILSPHHKHNHFNWNK